jgi:Leucine-rich repeat (LRR) protein
MITIKEYTIKDWFIDNNYSLEEQNKLTSLNCFNDKLTSLEGIENCPNLEWLYCWNNQLTSLNGIEKLNKLTYLKCDDIEGIEQYDNKNIKINIFLY